MPQLVTLTVAHRVAQERLAALRDGIDRADTAIIALLGERQRLARAIGHAKASAALPVVDADRESAVTTRYAELAERHGVDPVLAAQLAQTVIGIARAAQVSVVARQGARRVA
jgi:chorismate mutase